MRENPDFFVGGPNVAVWGDSRCEGAAGITQALNPSDLDKLRDTLRKDAKDANTKHPAQGGTKSVLNQSCEPFH